MKGLGKKKILEKKVLAAIFELYAILSKYPTFLAYQKEFCRQLLIF